MIARFLLGAAFAFAATAAHAACGGLSQIASLDVTVIGGEVFVPVTLAGESGLMELSLTGLTSVVTEDFVKRHDLRRDSISQNVHIVLDGQEVHQRVSVPLKMGGSSGEVHMGIVPKPLDPDARVLGFLGLDVLNRFDVELDLGHGKVNFFSPDHCKGQVVYWTRSAPVAVAPLKMSGEFSFVVPMQLDGKDIDAQFTTHSQGMLNGEIAREDYGTGDETGHVFKMLAVEGLGIANPRLAILPAAANPCNGHATLRDKPLLTERNPEFQRCYGMPDLMLGQTELRHLRVFIAFAERNVYVTAADAS